MHPEALTENSRAIFPHLRHFKDFYLAGGTALALQIGHRVSVDFDLFSRNPIKRELYPEVRKMFKKQNIEPAVNGLRMLGIAEMAATKAYSIGRRGSYKDYVDLYFIISSGYCSVAEIIKLAQKKYGAEFNARLFLEQLVYLSDIIDEPVVFIKKRIAKSELERFFARKIKQVKL